MADARAGKRAERIRRPLQNFNVWHLHMMSWDNVMHQVKHRPPLLDCRLRQFSFPNSCFHLHNCGSLETWSRTVPKEYTWVVSSSRRVAKSPLRTAIRVSAHVHRSNGCARSLRVTGCIVGGVRLERALPVHRAPFSFPLLHLFAVMHILLLVHLFFILRCLQSLPPLDCSETCEAMSTTALC